MICGQIHLPSQFWHVATLTINRKNALRRITFPSFPFDMSFHTFCAPVLSIRMIARVHVCVFACMNLPIWISSSSTKHNNNNRKTKKGKHSSKFIFFSRAGWLLFVFLFHFTPHTFFVFVDIYFYYYFHCFCYYYCCCCCYIIIIIIYKTNQKSVCISVALCICFDFLLVFLFCILSKTAAACRGLSFVNNVINIHWELNRAHTEQKIRLCSIRFLCAVFSYLLLLVLEERRRASVVF